MTREMVVEEAEELEDAVVYAMMRRSLELRHRAEPRALRPAGLAALPGGRAPDEGDGA